MDDFYKHLYSMSEVFLCIAMARTNKKAFVIVNEMIYMAGFTVHVCTYNALQ